MNTDRAYLIIPKLIEQPTWGGTYIVSYKNISSPVLRSLLIGQSYELSAKSSLSLVTDSKDPRFIPEVPETTEIKEAILLESFIAQSPVDVLGKKASQVFNNSLKTLIKFTQAKGNSFQLHVKTNSGAKKWQPKPESWYFLEEGLATLGIKDSSKIQNYKNACFNIESYLKILVKNIKEGIVSLAQARQSALNFIAKQNIYSFVNLAKLPKFSIIDLSAGGIHHSWEEDYFNLPNGNIVYEVQADVSDELSTIRCFDKGKITDEGNVREVQIEDYFQYLDADPLVNSPDKLVVKAKIIDQKDNYQVEEIFNTPYYRLEKINFTNTFSINTAFLSFHHIFVLEGEVSYSDPKIQLQVSKGHSLFVPAKVGQYMLKANNKATILKTYFI